MLVPGGRLGPYHLVKRLGEGGFGVVWLAEKRTALAVTRFALKVPLVEDPDVEAVRREAEVWQRAAGHPNVLPLIEADILDGRLVIVSEYAAGGSLKDWLSAGGGRAPSVGDAVEMALGILEGLEHLHAQGILHRDLKPANVLMQAGRPRITDFGLARVLRSSGHSATVTGTLPYMAPEAFDGERSEQTDVWSAGVMLHQMLSGRLPFPYEDMTRLFKAILKDPPGPLPETVPPALREVVSRALAKAPAERYPSARAMREALWTVAVQGGYSRGAAHRGAVPPGPPPGPVPDPDETGELVKTQPEPAVGETLVACSVCGRPAESGKLFTCPDCGKGRLCPRHRDPEWGVCLVCAETRRERAEALEAEAETLAKAGRFTEAAERADDLAPLHPARAERLRSRVREAGRAGAGWKPAAGGAAEGKAAGGGGETPEPQPKPAPRPEPAPTPKPPPPSPKPAPPPPPAPPMVGSFPGKPPAPAAVPNARPSPSRFPPWAAVLLVLAVAVGITLLVVVNRGGETAPPSAGSSGAPGPATEVPAGPSADAGAPVTAPLTVEPVPNRPDVPENGSLRIQVNAEATVRVNGTVRGTAAPGRDLVVEGLAPGLARLKATPERPGFAGTEDAVRVAGGVEQRVVLHLPESAEASGAAETGRDGPYVAYADGTVLDTRTGLMWAARDNGSDIDWPSAKRYCQGYRGGGHTDWRMPTLQELEGLYDPGKSYVPADECGGDKVAYHLTRLIHITCCCPWASDTKDGGASVGGFDFSLGRRVWGPPSDSGGRRALPVRRGR